MNIAEISNRLKNVEVAGRGIEFEKPTLKAYSIKYVLSPAPEQIPELKAGEPLLTQEDDHENELTEDGDKMVLVVSLTKNV